MTCTFSNEEIKQINRRVSKIENGFEELQIAIIRKIGDYGENIEKISKEISSQRESFSKILDPLTDNIRELQKITGTSNTEQVETKHKTETHSAGSRENESRRKSKKSTSFEDYLR